MTHAFLEWLNATAEPLFDAGSAHFLQIAVLAIVLALIDVTFGRRLGPHWRCALWMLFFIKLALPPHVALPSSPAYWFTWDSAPSPVAAAQTMVPATNSSAWGSAAVAAEAAGAGAEPAMSTGSAADPQRAVESSPTVGAFVGGSDHAAPAKHVLPSAKLLLLIAWAVGVVGFAAITWGRRRRLWSALAQSIDAPERLQRALDSARAHVGLRRTIRLRLTQKGIGPLVAGLVRPTIYLPAALADELSEAQLRSVLVHELLHVRRGDLWVTAVQTIARIVFFHHPAVWWVNTRVARLREEATDRAVLSHHGVDAREYSLALVAAAEAGLAARPVSPFALGVIETKSQLERRIKMNLMHPRSHRAQVGWPGLFTVAALGLVLVPMAPAGSSGNPAKAPAGFTAADAAPVVQQVDDVTARIFTAFNGRDRNAYVAAFTPDSYIMAPGAPMQTGYVGAADGYHRVPPGLEYHKILWKDRQFHRVGKWLVETGLAGLQFRLNGGAIMTDPREALTFWEEGADGQLRVKVLAWNPLPQPPAWDGSGADARAFAFAGTAAPVSTKGDFKAVLEAEEVFHRAFDEGKFEQAADTYAEQAILLAPGTYPLRGRDAIRRHTTGVVADHAPKVDRTLAHVEGNESHVLVVNLFRWTLTPPGSDKPVSISGKGVHLWQRQPDGAWKILFDLSNPSQPSPD